LANNHAVLGTFPFGNPVKKVKQAEISPKPVFILGVYGSAVFAQFKPANSKFTIRYLPIDNEPEVFWRGTQEYTKKIISNINVPKLAGKLVAEDKSFNGILGRLLDKYYLHPLKLQRDNVWICNLIPHTVLNKNERKSLKKYNDLHTIFNLPEADIPTKKDRWSLINKKRYREIIAEIFQARSEVMITLGQQPLKWFLKEYDKNMGNLLNNKDYGFVTEIQIESIKLKLIPLFHPRQLLKIKNRDTRVGLLHYDWLKNKAKKIKLV
jgi:uracil-DNA glycosylase